MTIQEEGPYARKSINVSRTSFHVRQMFEHIPFSEEAAVFVVSADIVHILWRYICLSFFELKPATNYTSLMYCCHTSVFFTVSKLK